MRGKIIRGRLATGVGQGKHFTMLDWARRQFIDKLGIDPFLGTINVIVEDSESMSVWDRLTSTPGVRIDNPNGGPHDCDARCFQVSIEGQVNAAIVLPEVAGYPPNADGPAAQSHHRRGGHEPELGVGDWQRAAPPKCSDVMIAAG